MTSHMDWLGESKKLSMACCVLEKAHFVVRDDDLNNEWKDLRRGRDSALDSTKKKLVVLKQNLREIGDRMGSLKVTSGSSGNLHVILENFETKLSSYKKSMRAEFDHLLGEEAMLTDDVDLILMKIDAWDKESSSSSSSKATRKEVKHKEGSEARVIDRYDKHIQIQSEIGAIDREIASNGGRCGSWEDTTHDGFMRVWIQCIGQARTSDLVTSITQSQREGLLRRLIKSVPLKTQEEFEAHIDWYLGYNSLLQHKKNLIEDWKNSRIKAKSKQAKEVLFEEEADLSFDSKDNNKVPYKDREITKARIASWKEHKEFERKEKERRERDKEMKAKERREGEMKKRQELNRTQLEHWKKEEADTDEKVKQTEKKVAPARKIDPAELLQRQAQDRALTQIKMARKEAAQLKLTSRERKMQELQSFVRADLILSERDPDRLLSKTAAFDKHVTGRESLIDAETRRTTTSAHSSNMHMTGRDLNYSRRAPVSWLRGK